MSSSRGKTNILLVGEGNFSFSASLCEDHETHIVATCLKNEKCSFGTDDANVKFILNHGGEVFFDVDATKLNGHGVVGKRYYNRIIFNFPHIPGKMNIQKNRALLEEFFSSASRLLDVDGQIHISLCRGQSGTPADVVTRAFHDTWQVVGLAATSNLILSEVQPFMPGKYPYYKQSGFRGRSKSFSIENAFSFIFVQCKPLKCLLPVGSHVGASVSEIFATCFKKAVLEYHSVFQEHSKKPLRAMLTELVSSLKDHCSYNLTNNTIDSFLVDFCHRHALFSIESSSFNCIHEMQRSILIDFFASQLSRKHVLASSSTVSSTLFLPSRSAKMKLSWKPYVIMYAHNRQKLYSDFIEVLRTMFENFENSIDENSLLMEYFQLEDDLIHVRRFSPESELITVLSAKYEKYKIDGYEICRKSIFSVRKYDRTECELEENTLLCALINNIVIADYDVQYIALDVEHLALLKYSVFDERVLYCDKSYFKELKTTDGDEDVKVLRSVSLYPVEFVFDSSFWVPEDFSEAVLFIYIKVYLFHVISSVNVIDRYCDHSASKQSLCFRFVYSGLEHPLSKQKAWETHYCEVIPSLLRVFQLEVR